MQINAHSAFTFSIPRSKNWRKPFACLIWPNTGSTTCMRNDSGCDGRRAWLSVLLLDVVMEMVNEKLELARREYDTTENRLTVLPEFKAFLVNLRTSPGTELTRR